MKYYDIRKNLKIKKEKSDTNFKDVSKICTKKKKKSKINPTWKRGKKNFEWHFNFFFVF